MLLSDKQAAIEEMKRQDTINTAVKTKIKNHTASTAEDQTATTEEFEETKSQNQKLQEAL